MTTADILTWSEAVSSTPHTPVEVISISTDTRTLQPGQAYIALRGPHFDGHDFISQAIDRGAVALVVSKNIPESSPVPVIQVKDTLQALKSIARGYRQSLPIKVIAVAGSNGKTTVKDMTAAMLSSRYRITKTQHNNNNRIGVSMTLLAAHASDDFIVCEIGTNAPGEIAELCEVCLPNALIITNIKEEHLEQLLDIEGVFREESSALDFLNAEGLAVLPADDEFYSQLRTKSPCRTLSAGFHADADFCITNLSSAATSQNFTITSRGGQSAVSFTLPVPGRHMATNAALATAMANSYGVSLEECSNALSTFQCEKGRLNIHHAGGLTIIDDTYNASPASMAEALHVLDTFPGRKVAILGDMGELGPQATQIHSQLASVIAASSAELVAAVGRLSRFYAGCGKPLLYYDDANAAASDICRHTREGDAILVKGSRFMRMETIVNALKG